MRINKTKCEQSQEKYTQFNRNINRLKEQQYGPISRPERKYIKEYEKHENSTRLNCFQNVVRNNETFARSSIEGEQNLILLTSPRPRLNRCQ